MSELCVLIIGAACLLTSLTIMVCVKNSRAHSQDLAHSSSSLADASSLEPPAKLRPGMIGCIRGNPIHKADLLATVIDLSARGYLILAPLRDEKRTYDWVANRTTKAPQDLYRYEETLLETIATSSSPTISQLLTSQGIEQASQQLSTQIVKNGWLAEDHRLHLNRWGLAGSLLLVIGLLVSVVMLIDWLASGDLLGLIGAILIVAGALVLASLGLPDHHLNATKQLNQDIDHFRVNLTHPRTQEISVSWFTSNLAWAIQLGAATQLADLVDARRATAKNWHNQQQFLVDWVRNMEPYTASQLADALLGLVTMAGQSPNRNREI